MLCSNGGRESEDKKWKSLKQEQRADTCGHGFYIKPQRHKELGSLWLFFPSALDFELDKLWSLKINSSWEQPQVFAHHRQFMAEDPLRNGFGGLLLQL